MPEKSQVWAVKFPDCEPFQVRDLPVGRLASIARNTGHSLIEVVGGPFIGDGEQLEPIIRLAAEWIGPTATVPDPLSFQASVGLFTLVDDDLPEPEGAPDATPPTGSKT